MLNDKLSCRCVGTVQVKGLNVGIMMRSKINADSMGAQIKLNCPNINTVYLICMYVYMYMHACIYIRMYACMCECMDVCM